MDVNEITLTRDEAQHILNELSELPIKYLGIVQGVQQFLAQKFEQTQSGSDYESCMLKAIVK